jgi:hypothetical protein
VPLCVTVPFKFQSFDAEPLGSGGAAPGPEGAADGGLHLVGLVQVESS